MLKYSVTTFDQWRGVARRLLAAEVAPDVIDWGDVSSLRYSAGSRAHAHIAAESASVVTGNASAVSENASAATGNASAGTDPSSRQTPHNRLPRISASLLRLLECIASYRHAGRWELMYRLAWRSIRNRDLLGDAADRDVGHAARMEKAVNRDVHKMHAFVRFREVLDAFGNSAYFAWFEPDHEILRRGVDFFVKRFPNMDWTIATPDGAAVWKSQELHFIDPPAVAARLRPGRPSEDAYEDLWRTYYRSICNAARINPAAMQREMPQRYWKHLPETVEIPALIRDGASKILNRDCESHYEGIIMAKAVKRSLPVPASPGESPQTCRRCDLWKQATQAVEGEGGRGATIMLVGEQPGDEEDLRGHPFVGPAGRVLDQAIAAAGLDRKDLFVTNAVKHFKWEPRGKRRLHKKPGTGEINACHFWLEQEIASVQPIVIVALGGTALRSLTGAAMSIESARQQRLEHPAGARILSTYHPSAILRAEGERIEELRTHLENDLRAAAKIARESAS